MRNRLQQELFKLDRVHDPYCDWYQVYRSEVTDRIKHWPANRKLEMESMNTENVNEGLERVSL